MSPVKLARLGARAVALWRKAARRRSAYADFVEHGEPMIPNNVRWLLVSGFGERWPWYKKWWHYLTRSGRARYRWPWERR